MGCKNTNQARISDFFQCFNVSRVLSNLMHQDKWRDVKDRVKYNASFLYFRYMPFICPQFILYPQEDLDSRMETEVRTVEDTKEKTLTEMVQQFHQEEQQEDLERERLRRLQVLNLLTMDDEEISQACVISSSNSKQI